MALSLKKQVLNGIAWRGASDITQQVLQIVFTIILARILSRGDFGLVAMALIVNRFVKAITSIGFGAAITQSQEITKSQISGIFYIQLVINILLTIVVFFGAETAAVFFNQLDLIPIIKALSFVIVLQTFQFPNILLTKQMNFKSFSIAEILSMVISNLAAILMAILGYGVWALVWRLIIQRVIFGILSFYFGKWLPSKPEFRGLKRYFSFGINLLGARVLYFFAENMIGLLTGRYLGKDIMGLFNIAFNLAIVPATKIQSILTSVLTPGFSKLQYQIDKFRTNYLKAIHLTSMVFIPLMVFIIAISQNLIPSFYGLEWQEAANYLMLLAIVGLLRGLSHILRSAIIAKGKSRIILISVIVEVLFSLPAMYLLMDSLSIYGLILGYLIGALSSWIFTVVYFNKVIESKNAIFHSIKDSLLISVILFIPVYSISFINLSSVTLLIIQILSGGLIFIILLRVFKKELLNQLLYKLKLRKVTSDA